MKLKTLFISLLAALSALPGTACTSAIISGKATPDGRPLMWKNRDTGNLNNCVRHIKGKRFSFVAITAYGKRAGAAWMGVNEKGFSIMNTHSYNLVEDEEVQVKGDRNGAVMYLALGRCATVKDFRNMLDTLKRPMRLLTNFGVIDAEGGASYFEVSGTRYKEYDVNDQNIAPHGFLVRANYSFSGKMNEGAGYIRYQAAEERIFAPSATGQITPRWIMENLSRSFYNPLTRTDLTDGTHRGWAHYEDFICRDKTSCAAIVQGVKAGENPDFTTMWTCIGYPPAVPMVPVWAKGAAKKLPRLLALSSDFKHCPLCDAGNALRSKVYAYKRGTGTENYIYWDAVFNAAGTGFMQRVSAIEEAMLPGLDSRIAAMRQGAEPQQKDIDAIYDYCDEFLTREYKERLAITLDL